MSELATCPFCGGEAKAMKDGIALAWCAGCGHCRCWLEGHTVDEVIQAWNRRANANAPTPVVEWPEEPSEAMLYAGVRELTYWAGTPWTIGYARVVYLAFRAAHIAEREGKDG